MVANAAGWLGDGGATPTRSCGHKRKREQAEEVPVACSPREEGHGGDLAASGMTVTEIDGSGGSAKR